MNDHAQEIRTRTRAIIDAGWYLQQRPRWESVVTVAQEITEHTDALAAQLVEAEARVERMTLLARSLGKSADFSDDAIDASINVAMHGEIMPDAARGEAGDAR